jgi:ribosomal protein L37AE/L43A
MPKHDIFAIDKKIQKNFANDRLQIPVIQKEIKSLKNLLSEPHSFRVGERLRSTIFEKEKELQNITNGIDVSYYIMKSKPILDEYSKILYKKSTISFRRGKKKDNPKKKELISLYLRIANEYLDDAITIKSKLPQDPKKCQECSSDILIVRDDGINTCGECGLQQHSICYTSSHTDIERTNVTGKYKYDPRIHFRDTLHRYQGKQHVTINPEVYTKLEKIMEQHHLLIDSSDKKARFYKVTKDHVRLFLKELGYDRHYENHILIHNHLTGQKSDDISHLEGVLMDDFDILFKMYNEEYRMSEKTERSSFISTQIVLFELLRRHGYKCDIHDFNVLKNIDRKIWHENVCSTIFAKCRWKYTSLL